MHSIARTQKILTFMSKAGECWQQKPTQHAPSSKKECGYLNGWINKTITYAKTSPKTVNSKDKAGERRRRRRRSRQDPDPRHPEDDSFSAPDMSVSRLLKVRPNQSRICPRRLSSWAALCGHFETAVAYQTCYVTQSVTLYRHRVSQYQR